jgi:threonine/homoserine/homoserine lactone efflux protein
MSLLFVIASGIFIGVIVAAPVGPVNLICIRRTLAFGRMNGFLSGAGAALGDGVFAVIVAFGLTAVSSFIQGYSGVIEVFGGTVLVAMGVYTFFSNPRAFKNPEEVPLPNSHDAGNLASAMTSTFFLTITNPVTMLGFMALFSGWLGIQPEQERVSLVTATILVGSVVAGSALWWAALSSFMGLFKGKMSFKRLKRINQVSGVMVAIFGAAVLLKVTSDAIF